MSYSSRPPKRDRLTLDPQLLPISKSGSRNDKINISPISAPKNKRVTKSPLQWPTPGLTMKSRLEDEIDDVLPKVTKRRRSSSPTEKIKVSNLLNNILSSPKPKIISKKINESEVKDNSKNWLNDLTQSLSTIPTDTYLKPDV